MSANQYPEAVPNRSVLLKKFPNLVIPFWLISEIVQVTKKTGHI